MNCRFFSHCQEEDRRIYSKDREIARRREEISQLDDRPPGLEDPADRLTEEEAAALAAARLIEEAEAEAETRHLGGGSGGEIREGMDTVAPRLNPPGPPPGLPPNVAGMTGLPPGNGEVHIDRWQSLWDAKCYTFYKLYNFLYIFAVEL